MNEEITIKLNWHDKKWVDGVKEMIARKIHQDNVNLALKEVAKEKMNMTSEKLEQVIQKAFEEATKDMAHWKLIRDWVQLDIKVKRMEKALIKNNILLESL